jgi:hypothetical protein
MDADETRDVRLPGFWENVLARARAGEVVWFTNLDNGEPFAALAPPGALRPEYRQRVPISKPAPDSDMTVRLGMVIGALFRARVLKPADIGMEPDFTGTARDIAGWLNDG